MVKFYGCILLILYSCIGKSQSLGGHNGFAFLSQPSNATIASSGGINVSNADFDVNRQSSNPALLNKEMDKHLSISYIPFFAQIQAFSSAYADQFRGNRFGVGIHYMNYGTMEETDASGNVTGTFQASDYSVSLSHARTEGAYTLGVTVKFIGSAIANYSSYGVAMDLGGVWKHPKKDWTIGLVIKNAGLTLKKYTPEASQQVMPFDVQIGTTFKPEFMPFRFFITAHHLHQPDIAYDDPTLNTSLDANGNVVSKKISFADKVARHITLGTELVLAKAFYIRLGYNHLVHQEMRLFNGAFNAGFSFGFQLKLKSLHIGYARFYQQAAGGVSYITLTANLGGLIKRKEVK
ncbi:type IX secretion system protein PorQ [Cytophagaceae bacterium DM2B3-1]|uniref:Type IX secretion system protein PorQ n=1 Tax=Xanthocytophaga flava TaxID=3048013 RepID=A0ABT7CPG4_9BACT|nr:type IX secretion system protein PorQ [Xanthocytophaga flavus]MDJ1495597.1 type IX secretion system protein PorQ [Xanthocytophaga flavus]